MASHPAAALLSTRWDLLAEYKDRRVREQKRLGIEHSLRIGDLLRRQVRALQPGWPSREDREEDFETHVRVAAALARTALPSRSSDRAEGSASVNRRSRGTRRVCGARASGDLRGMLRVTELDQERITATIAELEGALDQRDLRPLYDRLCRELARTGKQ